MRLSPTYFKSLQYAIFACFLMSWIGIAKCADSFENPVLKWKVGDHWAVQTYGSTVNYARGELVLGKGSPFFVQFEVSGISTSQYGQCYVVNVVYPMEPDGFQFSYLLFYTCKDGRLISINDNSTRSDGSKMNMQYKFDISTNMPTLTKNVFSDVPFDQPLFSEAGINLVVQEENREIRQQVVFNENGQGFTTVITVIPKYEEERRIVQKWEPKLPWWKESKVYKNDELIYDQEVILAAQVRLEPEALKVSPGILTAFVRLPQGFPASGITSANCDYAASERMMLNDDKTEMIMKFRRQDIEAALARVGESIDTNFVVSGTWQGTAGTYLFQGAASIKKIVGEQDKKK